MAISFRSLIRKMIDLRAGDGTGTELLREQNVTSLGLDRDGSRVKRFLERDFSAVPADGRGYAATPDHRITILRVVDSFDLTPVRPYPMELPREIARGLGLKRFSPEPRTSNATRSRWYPLERNRLLFTGISKPMRLASGVATTFVVRPPGIEPIEGRGRGIPLP